MIPPDSPGLGRDFFIYFIVVIARFGGQMLGRSLLAEVKRSEASHEDNMLRPSMFPAVPAIAKRVLARQTSAYE
jgi:hypothetical protein